MFVCSFFCIKGVINNRKAFFQGIGKAFVLAIKHPNADIVKAINVACAAPIGPLSFINKGQKARIEMPPRKSARHAMRYVFFEYMTRLAKIQ